MTLYLNSLKSLTKLEGETFLFSWTLLNSREMLIDVDYNIHLILYKWTNHFQAWIINKPFTFLSGQLVQLKYFLVEVESTNGLIYLRKIKITKT